MRAGVIGLLRVVIYNAFLRGNLIVFVVYQVFSKRVDTPRKVRKPDREGTRINQGSKTEDKE